MDFQTVFLNKRLSLVSLTYIISLLNKYTFNAIFPAKKVAIYIEVV